MERWSKRSRTDQFVLAKASNTTNLFQHLREHHLLIYAEAAPKKPGPKWGESSKPNTSNATQATLDELVAKSAMYTPSSPQAKELSRVVAYHIAKDAVPLSTVDKPGSQFMVSKLNPRYQIPSRRHFSDYEIPHLYSHVRDNVVLPKLKEATFFSATTDMWTSAANDSYMTITIHFISSDWELNSAWRQYLCLQITRVKILLMPYQIYLTIGISAGTI